MSQREDLERRYPITYSLMKNEINEALKSHRKQADKLERKIKRYDKVLDFLQKLKTVAGTAAGIFLGVYFLSPREINFYPNEYAQKEFKADPNAGYTSTLSNLEWLIIGVSSGIACGISHGIGKYFERKYWETVKDLKREKMKVSNLEANLKKVEEFERIDSTIKTYYEKDGYYLLHPEDVTKVSSPAELKGLALLQYLLGNRASNHWHYDVEETTYVIQQMVKKGMLDGMPFDEAVLKAEEILARAHYAYARRGEENGRKA